MDEKTDLARKAAFEATPIMVENRLFLSTPYNHVIALDSQTGAKLWEYDAQVDLSKNRSDVTSRGVSGYNGSLASRPGVFEALQAEDFEVL